jgi:ribosomal protein L2
MFINIITFIEFSNVVILSKKNFKLLLRRNFKKSFFRNSGRNNKGKITVFSKLGGSKRLFINYDIFRRLPYLGIVFDILKTAYRNSFLGLVFTSNGFLNLIILPNELNIGSILKGYSVEEFTTIGSSSLISNCFLGM